MARCAECGREEYLPYQCKFCGMSFCVEHRIPESHSCQGLIAYKEEMRNRGSIMYRPESQPEPVRRHKMSLFGGLGSGYLGGNYSLFIIAIAVVSFILQSIIPGYTSFLALSAEGVMRQPWSLVTYMFVHGSFSHLLFNMLFMAFFAPTLERMIGSRKFLEIFFLSGLLAGAVQVLIFGGAVVGASGGLFGVFAALAILAPQITVFVYFIPMRIMHALLIFAAIDILGMAGPGTGIAHLAHLTGVLVGLYYGSSLKGSRRRS